jgi:hypothetical protein
MPIGPEVYDRKPFSWTDEELRQAVTEGAVIRTRRPEALKVQWDARTPEDSQPWADAAGNRYAHWYLHPECERGCGWAGHLPGRHGVTD